MRKILSLLLMCFNFANVVATDIRTTEEKQEFFAQNGWTPTKRLHYRGAYLGDLEIFGICKGLSELRCVPNAKNLLDIILMGYLSITKSQEIFERGGAISIPASFETIEHLVSPLGLEKSRIENLRVLHKRLFDDTQTSHLVIVIDDEIAPFNDAIYFKQTADRGWGAFAQKKIHAGTIIGEYVGEVWLHPVHYVPGSKHLSVCRSERDSIDDSVRAYDHEDGHDSAYSAVLLPRDPQLILMGLVPQPALDVALIIDAKNVRNETAFINHARSNFNNVDYVPALKVTLGPKGGKELGILRAEYTKYLQAKNTIEIDTEMLLDYGLDDEAIKDARTKGIFLKDYSPTNTCYACPKSKLLQTCSRCKTARYCSRQCQIKDRQEHAPYCFSPK